MEQVKRDRRPVMPVSRVRTSRRYNTGHSASYSRNRAARSTAVRDQGDGPTFIQSLVFRCVLAALLFLAFCLGWWLDASSGYAAREWLKTAVTQELPESQAWRQAQQWNQAIGRGFEDVASWFRSIFSPDAREGDVLE